MTLHPLWTIFSGPSTTVPAQIGLATYIDIRDVSAMHIWCVEHPTASNGQRYLLFNAAPQHKLLPMSFEKNIRKEEMKFQLECVDAHSVLKAERRERQNRGEVPKGVSTAVFVLV